jgi:hypothetical protein
MKFNFYLGHNLCSTELSSEWRRWRRPPTIPPAYRAVDQNIRPRNKSRLLRAQVHRNCPISSTRPTDQRDIRQKLRVRLRVLQQRTIHLRRQRPRADPVARDPFARERLQLTHQARAPRRGRLPL